MGLWIAIEGIEGSGKTYLVKRLQDIIRSRNSKVLVIEEFPEIYPWRQIITDIIGKVDNEFFRTGHPISETLCFFALKLAVYDSVIEPNLKRGYDIIEDRSAYTNIAYGAAVLHYEKGISIEEGVNKLLKVRELLGPFPHYSLLIVDDVQSCIKRAESCRQRKFRKDEREIINIAYDAYMYLARIRDDIIIIDRTNLYDEEYVNAVIKTLRKIGVRI